MKKLLVVLLVIIPILSFTQTYPELFGMCKNEFKEVKGYKHLSDGNKMYLLPFEGSLLPKIEVDFHPYTQEIVSITEVWKGLDNSIDKNYIDIAIKNKGEVITEKDYTYVEYTKEKYIVIYRNYITVDTVIITYIYSL